MAELSEVDRFLYAASMEAFLRNYERAKELLTEAMGIDPEDARLYRQRGHRRLTTRDYEGAKADFEHAAQLEEGRTDEHEYYQDETEKDLINIILGRLDQVREQRSPVTPETIAANAGLYKSTLQASIWYHLALAHYLTGGYEATLANHERAAAVAIDDNIRIAITDWRYMTLRRLGRVDEAAKLLESVDTGHLAVTGDIHYLRRVQMYKGELTPEDLLSQDGSDTLGLATQGYGVGNWYLYNGNPVAAREVFERILAEGASYAFAFMAAEADLARWDQLVG